MATIVCSVYMVRYPLGGMLSWTLQWLGGLRDCGHEVWVVEKANYADACFDPSHDALTDDCSYGLGVVRAALKPFGLGDRVCFADYRGEYHGVSRDAIEAVLRSADVLLDLGNHGAWLEEARECGARVLVDGEPGYTQMKMAMNPTRSMRGYDYYYTNGANVGTAASSAPAAGCAWHHVFNPVMTGRLQPAPMRDGAPFTTIMNWQAHSRLAFAGRTYGQKDIEFERFIDLPRRVDTPMEIAVAGAKTPRSRLEANGWRVRNAHEVTSSIETYLDYIHASAGEFSVCKNVFVATRAGWFSDRSAAYLASGRPVVIQDTGIETLLPCGEGLFAVSSAEAAADAIQRITADPHRHSEAARGIAVEYLDARVVLGKFLREIGIG
jgi:hypothetical protein